MALSSEERVLPYTLCACTGSATMFNVILLIWHCVKFKSTKETRYLKYAFGGLTIAYAFLGLAITLLILYSDLGSTDLCKIGGFLVVFSTQESFWMLATSCLVLYLWIRSITTTPGSGDHMKYQRVTNKWSVPIFILLLVVKCIVLAIVSFLPMTNIAYFTMDGAYYYLCIPLRLPNETGWPYSTLVIIINWIALFIGILVMVAYNIRIRGRNLSPWIAHEEYMQESNCRLHKSKIKLQFWMNAMLNYNIAFWALILLLISINYFSGGESISQNSVQWTVGFLVSILIMSHPILVCLLHAVMKTTWFSRTYYEPEESFMTRCPKKLESIQKLAASFQHKDINQYLVHWKDLQGHFSSGIMKVFHPSAIQKWKNEVAALTRIGHSHDHPNVLKHHWQARENRYSGAICMLTGDMLSLESGLLCKSYYAHGNLYQFLKVRIHQLTEVGIHKLTLDVANGLDFVHNLHIVHNQLSTKCVYMASVSEKIGLRAVIGDFENSYIVSQKRNDHMKDHLYAISYGQNLKTGNKDNSEFTSDIRSFGVMVLEMLISLSEYNHNLVTKTLNQTKSSKSMQAAFKNSPVVNYGQRSHTRRQQQHRHSRNCTRTGKVTDTRAHDVNCKRIFSRTSPIFKSNTSSEFSFHNSNDLEERESSIDTYLDPIEERRDSSPVAVVDVAPNNTFSKNKMNKIQQRELPAIPIAIEKVVNEVSMSALSMKSHETEVEPPKTVKEQCVKPKLKPKPNLLKSIQRSITISESGESDVDSIYPKSPENFQGKDTSTDSDQSPESTLSLSKSSDEKNEVVSDDMYNASVNSCGSFDTIYEDDESQESTPQSLDSGSGKNKEKYDGMKKCDTVVKRKLPAKCESEVWKKKRLSGASFNDSILSGDSGMGSSHYGTSSEAYISGGTVKERGAFTPGSRSAIYQEGPPSSDSDSYSLLMAYLEKNSQKINGDGLDIVLSSDGTLSGSSELQNFNHADQLQTGMNEENFDDLYEMLPDLMVRKKPCRGQHRHIQGASCCTAPPKPPRRKNRVKSETLNNSTNKASKAHIKEDTHLYESVKKSNKSAFSATKQSAAKDNNSVDPSKLLVDECTMTTDSLEKKSKASLKCDSHGIQADSESIITDISCLSGRTLMSKSECSYCGNGGKVTSDSDSQISMKPPIHHTQQKSRPGNVPKLGITAVAFSRQANNGSGLSSPISSMCPSGSMQSLTAGRSSVMSGSSNGRQSARSLVGGSSSINNSVMTLLQDSNLYVANAENKTCHQQGYNKRSNKGVFQELYSGPRGIALQSQSQLHSQVVTNHPVVQQIVELSSNQDSVSCVLDTLKRKGRLGYTATQLVPLLKECWLEQEVPSTNQILVKLGQVLPTATV